MVVNPSLQHLKGLPGGKNRQMKMNFIFIIREVERSAAPENADFLESVAVREPAIAWKLQLAIGSWVLARSQWLEAGSLPSLLLL
jgi:hypothetical protein